jgi:hypothetical protein
VGAPDLEQSLWAGTPACEFMARPKPRAAIVGRLGAAIGVSKDVCFAIPASDGAVKVGRESYGEDWKPVRGPWVISSWNADDCAFRVGGREMTGAASAMLCADREFLIGCFWRGTAPTGVSDAGELLYRDLQSSPRVLLFSWPLTGIDRILVETAKKLMKTWDVDLIVSTGDSVLKIGGLDFWGEDDERPHRELSPMRALGTQLADAINDARGSTAGWKIEQHRNPTGTSYEIRFA